MRNETCQGSILCQVLQLVMLGSQRQTQCLSICQFLHQLVPSATISGAAAPDVSTDPGLCWIVNPS